MIDIRSVNNVTLTAATDFFSQTLGDMDDSIYPARMRYLEVAKFNAYQLWHNLGSKFHLLEASINDERVGLLIAEREPDVWRVHWVAVKAEHRKSGVGRALLERIALDAKSSQNDKLYAAVPVPHRQAIKVWQNSGWVAVATLTGYWHGLDYYIFEKAT